MRAARLPAALAVTAALVLPWTTWLRFAAPTPEAALSATPLFLFTLTALLVGALLLAPSDPWLGAFVAYTALLSLQPGDAYALDVAQYVGLGALLLWAARQIPAAWRPTVRATLAFGAVLQLVYCLHRAFGYDVLWVGLEPAVSPTPLLYRSLTMIGTLGNENHVAALLGLVLPLASPWLWPILVTGLLLTKSAVGVAAAGAGLLVRYRSRRLAALPALGLGALYVLRGSPLVSTHARLTIWRLGLWDWLLNDPSLACVALGVGPGAWFSRIPSLQRRFWISGEEWFFQAHSEFVQLAHGFGLVGLALLVGWLVYHRALWGTPFAGSCAALLVVALGSFPFHHAPLALTALIVLGLATPQVARAGLHVPAVMLRPRLA